MPGVRREDMSDASRKWQAGELIHCSRGKIAVQDRSKLEAPDCECHAVVKREYDCKHPQITAA